MTMRPFRVKSHQSVKQKMYLEFAWKSWVHVEGEYLFLDDSVTQAV